MKTYHISEFEWFVPTPKNKLGINFLRTDSFTLNAAFCAELSPNIHIGFHPTDKAICFQKAKEEGSNVLRMEYFMEGTEDE